MGESGMSVFFHTIAARFLPHLVSKYSLGLELPPPPPTQRSRGKGSLFPLDRCVCGGGLQLRARVCRQRVFQP